MKNEGGYSLLEVMISMVVLAVAFLAIIATQLGTLKGYVSARDTLRAAELGRRTGDLLRIQGTQWISNVDHDSDVATIDSFLPADVYESSEAGPFDVTDPIGTIRGAPTWVALVDDPVDARFNRVRSDISDNHLGGKFCIYARGRDMQTQFTNFASGDGVTGAIRFQIAIVWPGPNATLTNCTGTGPITPALLDMVGGSSTSPPTPPGLEGIGMRVAYFGTIVIRRAHLTSFAGGSQS